MYFGNFVSKNVGNNALSYQTRKELSSKCELYIPSIKNIGEICVENLEENLLLGDNIVFEESFNGKLYPKIGLKNYIEGSYKHSRVYIFDNHNISFYFIGKHFLQSGNKFDLIHIDQHSDMYEPDFIPNNLQTIEDIEKYTFEGVNVGNYLIPAQKLGFINEIYQKRTELSVLELNSTLIGKSILNIDLDFWAPEMGTTIESLKKIRENIGKSPIVLIATSPYFIEQNLAVNLAKQLFY